MAVIAFPSEVLKFFEFPLVLQLFRFVVDGILYSCFKDTSKYIGTINFRHRLITDLVFSKSLMFALPDGTLELRYRLLVDLLFSRALAHLFHDVFQSRVLFDHGRLAQLSELFDVLDQPVADEIVGGLLPLRGSFVNLLLFFSIGRRTRGDVPRQVSG